jgi:DNA-binding CsgD family transcriptional regulator
MSGLSRRDLRDVLDVVHAANEDGRGELPVDALRRIGRLVGAESVSYNRVDHTSPRLLGTVNTPAEADISVSPAFHPLLAQHPAFVAYRSGRLAAGTSVALSDLVDARTLRRMPLYVDFYRPRGTEDQLLSVVRVTRQRGAVLILNRGRRGFTARDRAVLDVLLPHLGQTVARRERATARAAAARSAVRDADRLQTAVGRLPGLTPRERQVVEHLLGGATDREIGRALGVAHRTVHKHLEQVYRKLGLANRTSLVAAVYAAGPATGAGTGTGPAAGAGAAGAGAAGP